MICVNKLFYCVVVAYRNVYLLLVRSEHVMMIVWTKTICYHLPACEKKKGPDLFSDLQIYIADIANEL